MGDSAEPSGSKACNLCRLSRCNNNDVINIAMLLERHQICNNGLQRLDDRWIQRNSLEVCLKGVSRRCEWFAKKQAEVWEKSIKITSMLWEMCPQPPIANICKN